MTNAVEIQVISKILTSDDEGLVNELCAFDSSYYAVYTKHIEFILNHRSRFGTAPDVFTFLAEFPDVTLVEVSRETKEFLIEGLKQNKQRILLLNTFNKLKDLGSGDVTEAWEFLNQQCETANQLNDTQPMNIIAEAKERADQVVEWSKSARIPTGFAELDKLTYGGWSTVEELVALVASTNSGKAQPLWSKVLTPTGWVRMGDIKVGDVVVGENNDNGRVVKIFPQGEVDYYRIHFSDGTFAECCGNHLWKVLDKNRRIRKNKNYGQHMVLTLDQIRTDYKDKKYSVDISDAIEFESEFNLNQDVELNEFAHQIFLDKCIPMCYFTAPVQIRKDLLSLLISTYGHPSSTDILWEFDFDSESLVREVAELARSLGLFVIIRNCDNESQGFSRFSCICYKDNCKFIEDIEYMGKTECQCIMLDNVTHTYLTDDYTVTHNTWVCTKMMEAAHRAGFPVAFYSPEMQSSYVATRFDTWRAHFKNSDLFQGKYTDDYKSYLEALRDDPVPAFIIEDKDMPDGVSPRHLETFIKQHGIKLLIIDGISYMSDDRRASSEYERLTHISKDLFQISKKHGCAIVVAVQANRDTKDAKDEKGVPFPSIYNIAGSFSIVQIATQVFAMRQIFDKHVFEIKLEKTRMAKNDKNILSYSWDVNTGNMQYMQGDESEDPMLDIPKATDIIANPVGPDNTGLDLMDLMGGEDDVEF